MSQLLEEFVDQLRAISEAIERLSARSERSESAESQDIQSMLTSSISAVDIAVNCISLCIRKMEKK